MSFRCLILLILIVTSPLTQSAVSSETVNESSKEVVYFSAITLYHPIVMYQKYQPLMKYLTEKTPYRFELKLSQDYKDIIGFLKTNQVQVALLGGVTYLEAKKEFNVIPVLIPIGADGKPFYRCVLITRETNKEINTISDLKGKSFAFASKLSTSGYLSPLYHIYSKSDVRLKDFTRYKNFRYHDSVAREILRGNFDAGAVIDSVADRFKGRGLKIIDVFEPIPGLPIVMRANASPELVNAIKNALLSLEYSNPEHRKIMEQWDEEFKYGFTEAEDSDYDPIRKMIEYLNKEGIKIP